MRVVSPSGGPARGCTYPLVVLRMATAGWLVVHPMHDVFPVPCAVLACRKVDMAPDEVLLSVHIPFTRENEFTREFKQSPRRDDDIAIVNAGAVHTPTPARKPICLLEAAIRTHALGSCT